MSPLKGLLETDAMLPLGQQVALTRWRHVLAKTLQYRHLPDTRNAFMLYTFTLALRRRSSH